MVGPDRASRAARIAAALRFAAGVMDGARLVHTAR